MSSPKKLSIGLDIGSTTVKLVCIDEENHILFKRYERHLTDIQSVVSKMFREANELLFANSEGNSGNGQFLDNISLGISGSGGMGLASSLHIPFAQEVCFEINFYFFFVHFE